jgi:hypothetical protein
VLLVKAHDRALQFRSTLAISSTVADQLMIICSGHRRSSPPSVSAARHAKGRRLDHSRHRPISPSGRQDLNLRPLDPQARRSNPLDQRKCRIPRLRRVCPARFRSVQRSTRTMAAPVSLQQPSLQDPLHPGVAPPTTTHAAPRRPLELVTSPDRGAGPRLGGQLLPPRSAPRC